MRDRFTRFKKHPITQETLKNLKPKKNLWGIFSVILFFIVPEIAAFFWGDEIIAFAQHKLQSHLPFEEEYLYKGIETLGEPSYFNLLFGVSLLVWLFF